MGRFDLTSDEETLIVKKEFERLFPDAFRACSSSDERERIHALTMYAAFKGGWEASTQYYWKPQQ